MIALRKPLLVALAAAFVSTSSIAATKTLDAGNYTISYDDSVLGLFGTPTLNSAGNLVFAPSGSPGFTAQSDSGWKFANSTIALTITADAGYKLTNFSLTEQGDYMVIGSGMVGVGGQLRAIDLVGGNKTYTSAISSSAPLTATTGFPPVTTDWTATSSLGLTTTKAVVSIQSILGARTTAGNSYAFIEKNGVNLGVNVMPVPEPETYGMLLAGLGVIGAISRRRVAGR